MSDLLERIKWTIMEHIESSPDIIAIAVVKEIESTHRICDPEQITDPMVEACFNALPANYDPPDPKRRPWHAYKAKHRYTAMCKSVKSILTELPIGGRNG